ncbi:MAG TPA: DUF3368 domain-containing protein [Candidatus Aenigmarchaeota archaeon]|nr:DUF3368 domain-containing protein [Candidatus Aenigmarchaeota archaeon]
MGYIRSLKGELDKLINSGFWLSEDVYTRALSMADEPPET